MLYDINYCFCLCAIKVLYRTYCLLFLSGATAQIEFKLPRFEVYK